MNELEIWIQFANEVAYKSKEEELNALFSDDGEAVVIYLSETKGMKRLSEGKTLSPENCDKVRTLVGEDNVKIVTKEKDMESKRNICFPDPANTPLERIADALESIDCSLSEIAVSMNGIDKNIDDCIVSPARGSGRLLQITGNVFTQ